MKKFLASGLPTVISGSQTSFELSCCLGVVLAIMAAIITMTTAIIPMILRTFFTLLLLFLIRFCRFAGFSWLLAVGFAGGFFACFAVGFAGKIFLVYYYNIGFFTEAL